MDKQDMGFSARSSVTCNNCLTGEGKNPRIVFWDIIFRTDFPLLVNFIEMQKRVQKI